MRNYNKCKKCGVWHWNYEKCPDEYTVYHDDYLEKDGKKMCGYGFNDVAERYAKYYDEDEHPLLDETIEIEIEDKDGLRKKFKLRAEPSIEYYTEEI